MVSLWWILASFACGPAAQRAETHGVTASVVQPEPDPTLHVEIAGCEGGERATNTCVIRRPGVMSIWVAGPILPQLSLDGARRSATLTEAIDGGWRNTSRNRSP